MMGTRCWNLVWAALLCASHVASQTPVQVDDSQVYSLSNPSGVQFSSSGWSTVNPTNADLRFDGTYTWSQTPEANLIFFFQGSSIAYYADKGPNRGLVTISLDGQPYTNVSWQNVGSGMQYQQQMWSASGLSPGDHQVVLSNMGARIDVPSGIMGLDYFEIVPASVAGAIAPANFGPGSSNVPANARIVDNEDNSISYSGTWITYSSGVELGLYFGETQHSSIVPGSTCTFKFTGTAVWYFSDFFSQNTNVSISVDGGPGDIVSTASTGDTWLTQKLTWSKTGLTDSAHTVVITHVGTKGDFANVDFFMYLPSANAPPTTTSSASTSASSTSTASPAILSSSKPAPIGAIVGGAVGGVVLIALIAGLLIYLHKRKPSPQPGANGPQHEAYSGEAAYHTKEANVGYPNPNSYGHGPALGYGPGRMDSPGFRPPSPHTAPAGSIAPTTWTGATYAGHPEIH